jgi:hypothetical protein
LYPAREPKRKRGYPHYGARRYPRHASADAESELVLIAKKEGTWPRKRPLRSSLSCDPPNHYAACLIHPPNKNPADIKMAGVKQVGVSSMNEEHVAYLSDADLISLRLFAWQLSDGLTTMPYYRRFLTRRIYLVVDENSDAPAVVSDRDISRIYRLDRGGAPNAIGFAEEGALLFV